MVKTTSPIVPLSFIASSSSAFVIVLNMWHLAANNLPSAVTISQIKLSKDPLSFFFCFDLRPVDLDLVLCVSVCVAFRRPYQRSWVKDARAVRLCLPPRCVFRSTSCGTTQKGSPWRPSRGSPRTPNPIPSPSPNSRKAPWREMPRKGVKAQYPFPDRIPTNWNILWRDEFLEPFWIWISHFSRTQQKSL